MFPELWERFGTSPDRLALEEVGGEGGGGVWSEGRAVGNVPNNALVDNSVQ